MLYDIITMILYIIDNGCVNRVCMHVCLCMLYEKERETHTHTHMHRERDTQLLLFEYHLYTECSKESVRLIYVGV